MLIMDRFDTHKGVCVFFFFAGIMKRLCTMFWGVGGRQEGGSSTRISREKNGQKHHTSNRGLTNLQQGFLAVVDLQLASMVDLFKMSTSELSSFKPPRGVDR